MLPSLKMPQHNLKRDFKETRTLVKLFCVLRCRKNSTAMYTVLPFPIGWIYCVNLDSMFVHTFELSSCQQENVAIFSRHSHQTRFNKHYLSEGWWLDSNRLQQPLHNLTKLRYAHSMLDLEDQLPRWLLLRANTQIASTEKCDREKQTISSQCEWRQIPFFLDDLPSS